MREIHATVTLENIEDPSRQTTVEGFVDTDAVNLVIPEEVATELRLRHQGTRTVVYADGRREPRPVANVRIEIGDVDTYTDAIVGPAGSQILIGHVVLSMMSLVSRVRDLGPHAGDLHREPRVETSYPGSHLGEGALNWSEVTWLPCRAIRRVPVDS